MGLSTAVTPRQPDGVGGSRRMELGGGGWPKLAIGVGGWMSSCYLRLYDSDLWLGIAGTNDQKPRQSPTARSPETSPAHPIPRRLPGLGLHAGGIVARTGDPASRDGGI